MELCSNVFFGGVVNDKHQPDVCICLAKLAELSALFLAARRNFTKFCDVISWIFLRDVLYRDPPLRAGKRPKLNYCEMLEIPTVLSLPWPETNNTLVFMNCSCTRQKRYPIWDNVSRCFCRGRIDPGGSAIARICTCTVD